VLPFLLISLVIVFNFLPVKTCLSCLVDNKSLPAAAWGPNSDLFHVGWMTIGLLLATVMAAPTVFFISMSIAAKSRVRRLKRQLTEKLLPILDKPRDSPSKEAGIAAH